MNTNSLVSNIHVPAPVHLLSPQQQSQPNQFKTPLASVLVPYIWPTSPASFCTGVVVGLIVALLRPIIEHYVDVGAKYIAVIMRFSLIWGSVALIAWAILRVLQQTSSTVVSSPSMTTAPQQQQSSRYLIQAQGASVQSSHLSSSPVLSSSAESLYSFTTTSSANTGSSTYSNYTPKPPHLPMSAATAATGYNPYTARTPSPVRSASPTRMSPTRKMVGPIMATGGATPGSVSASVRRMEPRIVPIDDGSDTGTPDSAGFRNYLRAKDAVSVLEKPVGQSAFRIRRRP